jgi:predicted transglutaminase-like cysteine proteinase
MKAKSVDDKWVSPLAALVREFDDCKSYAAVKYVALNDAGIAPDDLRLIIVHIRTRDDDHAVVATHDVGHWLILDNRRMVLLESKYLPDYEPLFAFDYRCVSEFVVPGPKAASMPCTGTFG